MSSFYFIMQHKPTPEQLQAARAVADRILALAPAKAEDRVEGIEYAGSIALLSVPDDPNLGREWFVDRAREIFEALTTPGEGDIVHAMGQQQLAMALTALARWEGAKIVESVTARESIEVKQADGSVKKESVFRFRGFRTVHEY